MVEFVQFLEMVWEWIKPYLGLIVTLVILAYALRTAWENFISQMLIEPLVKAVTGKPWYVSFMRVTKQIQPALIAACAVYIAVTAHLDLTTVFGNVIPVSLADETTRQIASGLVWAVSSIFLHKTLPTAQKNASNVSGGSSGVVTAVG